MKNRRWLWIILFICGAVLLGTLATGWNVVLVRDYRKMLELARTISITNQGIVIPRSGVVLTMTLGTVGFASALGIIILFFVRLLREMKLNQQQSEFLAAVSHELKTPIASIELSASLLRAGDLEPEEKQKLWRVHDSELKRLRSGVETLLETARLQSAPVSLERVPIALDPWLDTTAARWRELLGPEAVLRREGPLLEASALLDPKALDLITNNLLDNARKFARGAPDVTIRTHRSPGRWQIDVIDQGWGFDPADSGKIFDRFYRAKTEAPYAIPGNGLGLHLAKTASRAMGVRLRGNSNGVGRGAMFTIEGGEHQA